MTVRQPEMPQSATVGVLAGCASVPRTGNPKSNGGLGICGLPISQSATERHLFGGNPRAPQTATDPRQRRCSMNREDVLRVLSRHDNPATFSVLSRALITNNHERRRCSRENRAALHAVLRGMEAGGLLRLIPTRRGRGGHGLHIELLSGPGTPKDRSTQGESS